MSIGSEKEATSIWNGHKKTIHTDVPWHDVESILALITLPQTPLMLTASNKDHGILFANFYHQRSNFSLQIVH